MKTNLDESKTKKYWLIGGLIALAVLFLGGIGTYTYYILVVDSNKVEQISNPPKQNTKKEYPAETIIRKTDEENVVEITPSKEDTIQVKDSKGGYIEVPEPTPPPKR